MRYNIKNVVMSLFYGYEEEEEGLSLKGGKMEGDINIVYGRLYGIAAPIEPSGAVSKQYLEYQFPKGLICLWSGSNIPPTWRLCDGSSNTPDLRARFIMGWGNENVGVTGGSSTHMLTVNEVPSHRHDIPGYSNYIGSDGKSEDDGFKDKNVEINVGKSEDDELQLQTNTSGSGQPFSILPPYYVLAFIMKL